MINAIKKLFKPAPQKYHWYEVKFFYSKNSNQQFDFLDQIGLVKQTTVLDKRAIKKVIAPLHKHPGLRGHLNNGILNVQITAYLGYFSKTDK